MRSDRCHRRGVVHRAADAGEEEQDQGCALVTEDERRTQQARGEGQTSEDARAGRGKDRHR